jgi:hypothetical protein
MQVQNEALTRKLFTIIVAMPNFTIFEHLFDVGKCFKSPKL